MITELALNRLYSNGSLLALPSQFYDGNFSKVSSEVSAAVQVNYRAVRYSYCGFNLIFDTIM